MPCKDTTANLRIQINQEERIIDYSFAKLSCSKTVGEGESFKSYCKGKSLNELYSLELEDLFEIASAENEEEKFLLFLEWEAIRACAALYYGRVDQNEFERYKIASILHEDECVSISMAAEPLKDMPRIVPCSIQEKDYQSE